MSEESRFKQTDIGMVPEDWGIKIFSDVLLEKPRNGLYKPKNFHGKGTKMVNMGELFAYDKIGDSDMELIELTDSEKERFLLNNGDLVFARRSLVASGAGKCSLVVGNVERTFESSIIRARPDPSKANSEYLFYFFSSTVGKHLLGSILRQVAVAGITGSDLMNLKIPLPSLQEQCRIAATLAVLDEEIALNQAINKTLETIGQKLFKRWFVDFEFLNEEGKPYKSSGSEMVNNELLGKGIPKGWAVRELGDFIRFIKGKKPTLVSASQEEGFLPQILIDALDGMQPSFAQTKDMVVIKENDTLMVMDGASSGGVERGHKGVLGSTLAVIDVKEIGSAYVYHFLKGREEDTNQNTTGTSIPHTDKNMVEKYLVVVPDNERITNQFETISNSILSKSINNKLEIQTLQQIRDSLLPKLMSGKIRVRISKENVEA
jgi:type I restriction enzyme S subunit